MHGRHFFSVPRRPMFGRRTSREEDHDQEEERGTTTTSSSSSSSTSSSSFWGIWRTKKPSSSGTAVNGQTMLPAAQPKEYGQPRSLVPVGGVNGPSISSSSSSSRAITTATGSGSSNHSYPSSSVTARKEIDANFWRYVERVLFTRLEVRGQAPLVELVDAIRGCHYLQQIYGSAAIDSLLAPLDGSITTPPPYVRLTTTAEVVWVTLSEFRRRCESTELPASSSLVPLGSVGGAEEGGGGGGGGVAISPKRRRANHDHQGGQALNNTPSQSAGGVVPRAITSPPSVQASVDMQKDSYLALLSTMSKEYRAQEAKAEEEAAALGARVDGVLEGFGQRDDSLRAAMEELEAELEGRTIERRKTGAKDRRDREAEVEQRMTKDMGEELVRQRMAPLSDEDQSKVRLTLKNGRDNDVVVNGFNVDILRQHLRTCRPGTWLNDEVINFFMNLLKERDDALVQADPSKRPNWYFNSFFISKLLHDDHEYRYANVKRWSRKAKDLFAHDKVFFPVNINNSHWCLAVIYMQEKKIQYFDSMCGRGEFYLSGLKRYLQDEHQDKKKAPLPSPEDWKLVYSDPKITPQQGNGFDCGCFASAFAYLLSEDLPIKYASQADMPYFRERLVMSIMKKALTW